MKKLLYLIFAFSILGFISCSTSKNTSNSGSKNKSKEKSEISSNSTLDLTSQLRRLPGLTIRGDRESAIFTVRGVSTIVSGNQPLFIVNGIAIQDYPTVYRMVTPANFKSARILKNASETSFYGVRGANGVIIIRTNN